MSIFEAGMLICFGFAWPMNIYKSWTSRTNGGKSFLFLLIIWIGYLSGIINKVLYHRDIVMWLYVLNMSMVTVDCILFIRNARLDARRKAESAA